MKKILILISIFAIFATGCEQKTNDSYSENSGQTQQIQTQNITLDDMKKMPESGDTIAKIQTNLGEIKVLLYTTKAPETTKNFIELANADRYDGVIFHRVIDDFMVQTGDFENNNGTGGYSYKGPGTYLEDEFGKGLRHVRGALSMANRGANTGGSQFFIVQAASGTPHLDGLHAIFGYAYEGMDIVDQIAAAPTGPNDKPLDDIIIEDIEISKFK